MNLSNNKDNVDGVVEKLTSCKTHVSNLTNKIHNLKISNKEKLACLNDALKEKDFVMENLQAQINQKDININVLLKVRTILINCCRDL